MDAAERTEYIAGNLLSRAALLVRLLVRQVPNADIARTEGEVLRVLGDGPRRVTELAALSGVAQPTMTVLLRRLQTQGWVARAADPADGRVVLVSITRSGREAADAFRAELVQALRGDLADLSDDELAELLAATDALGAFVDALQRRVG